MQRIGIENTGIQVSRVSFGTGSLHHLFGRKDRQSLLTAAASAGVTHFDSSPYYGYGLAEEDVGRFLVGQRNAFTVTTKVGLYPWGPSAGSSAAVWARKAFGHLVSNVSLPVVNWHVDKARDSLQQSLKRLRTDHVDFLLLHEPARHLIEADEFLKWLVSAKESGAVRAWGVAGVGEHVAPWVEAAHPLAAVAQTRDSLAGREADFLRRAGRHMQFTYGYFASSPAVQEPETPEQILRAALARNATGAIIVSTRQCGRVASLARVAS